MNTHITRDGTELFFKDWGTGRPVIFAHEWPLSSDMWEYQMTYLADRGCRCIAYDRRGFGRSSQPWRGYDYDTFADDLASLMQSLDVIDGVLIGSYTGCGDVARYIGRHGSGRLAKTVLIGGLPPNPLRTAANLSGVEKAMFDQVRASIAENRQSFLSNYGHGLYRAPQIGAVVPAGVLEWTFAMAVQASPRATYDSITALCEADFSADFQRFDLPTLIMHGGRSFLGETDAGLELKKAIPHAVLAVYNDAPQAIWLTHKEKLNEDLFAFIDADQGDF
ncbi:alpha/beta hydrolase [Acidisoma cellulosilytica]|uniref:Alpha/beta hydrolase n=1 Tax=Acidisoma cellulosilyticum TaxID=2802395 RepID=A0A963Z6P1_9PROT|nr:alpha/beta hydrolase [Acidisoma cellulosilyticum]MCB8883810.1 alpha/beta hydrolase [Acidisoma cellulosilyticum]